MDTEVLDKLKKITTNDTILSSTKDNEYLICITEANSIDGDGDFYSEDVVASALESALNDNLIKKGIEHDSETSNFRISEMFLTKENTKFKNAKNDQFTTINKGSWMARIKIINPVTKENIDNDVFKGISIGFKTSKIHANRLPQDEIDYVTKNYINRSNAELRYKVSYMLPKEISLVHSPANNIHLLKNKKKLAKNNLNILKSIHMKDFLSFFRKSKQNSPEDEQINSVLGRVSQKCKEAGIDMTTDMEKMLKNCCNEMYKGADETVYETKEQNEVKNLMKDMIKKEMDNLKDETKSLEDTETDLLDDNEKTLRKSIETYNFVTQIKKNNLVGIPIDEFENIFLDILRYMNFDRGRTVAARLTKQLSKLINDLYAKNKVANEMARKNLVDSLVEKTKSLGIKKDFSSYSNEKLAIMNDTFGEILMNKALDTKVETLNKRSSVKESDISFDQANSPKVDFEQKSESDSKMPKEYMEAMDKIDKDTTLSFMQKKLARTRALDKLNAKGIIQ